jgi:hypothetical protein
MENRPCKRNLAQLKVKMKRAQKFPRFATDLSGTGTDSTVQHCEKFLPTLWCLEMAWLEGAGSN